MSGNARTSQLAVARFGLGTDSRFRVVTKNRSVVRFHKKAPLFIVSMSGIGPLSKAYESFVLPLNYTDNNTEYTREMARTQKSLLGFLCNLLRGHEWATNILLAVANKISLPRLGYFFC